VFPKHSEEEMKSAFQVNFFGPINISRAVLPLMRARGSGKILYISSVEAWRGYPGASCYSASKSALEGAVECLSQELALIAPAIKLHLVEPGYFRTSLFQNIKHVEPRQEVYREFNAYAHQYGASLTESAPGDLKKGVTRIVELVKGTGMAEGRTVPFRVPLGSDALKIVGDTCEGMMKTCKEWEDVARSTDREIA
jgi:NAD(P)-dependent dehydrogenase (short-subunit alcohol dehydrogenase family)